MMTDRFIFICIKSNRMNICVTHVVMSSFTPLMNLFRIYECSDPENVEE